jgi:hypothetical protein
VVIGYAESRSSRASRGEGRYPTKAYNRLDGTPLPEVHEGAL